MKKLWKFNFFPYLAFGLTFKNFFGLFQWHDKFEVTLNSRPHLYPMGGKIKKSNVLHYICLFPCSKNDFKCVWPFSCPKTAFKGRKINIDSLAWPSATWGYQTFNCPAFKGCFRAGKRPNTLEIVSATRKMTNEWSKVLLSKKLTYIKLKIVLCSLQDIHEFLDLSPQPPTLTAQYKCCYKSQFVDFFFLSSQLRKNLK